VKAEEYLARIRDSLSRPHAVGPRREAFEALNALEAELARLRMSLDEALGEDCDAHGYAPCGQPDRCIKCAGHQTFAARAALARRVLEAAANVADDADDGSAVSIQTASRAWAGIRALDVSRLLEDE
jgi:hypothetical protein